MTVSRSALGATSYAVLTRGLRASARIMIVFLLARFYGESDVAVFAYAFVTASLIGIVCDLGLTDFAVREIAIATSSQSLERSILLLRTLTAPLAIGGSVLALVATSATPLPVALSIAVYATSLAVSDLLGAIHRGHARYAHDTLEAGFATLPLAGASICAASGASVAVFHATLGIVGVAATGVRVLIAFRRARGGTSTVPLSTLVHAGRWFAARAVVTAALFELAVILLQQLSSVSELASFAVAQRPVGLMTQALTVIATVFLPTLSRTFAREPEQLGTTTSEVNLLYLAMVPAAFAACILGGEVFLTISGDAYATDVALVRTLALAILAYNGTLTAAPLLAARQERTVVIASVVGVVSLAVAGFLLIPARGAMGAAVATAVAMVAAKLVHILGYRAARLPLGDARHLAALLASAAFVAASSITVGTANYAILIVGGLASAVVAARRLYRMRIAASSRA